MFKIIMLIWWQGHCMDVLVPPRWRIKEDTILLS